VDSKHKGAVFLNTSDRGLVGAHPCVGHQNDLADDGRAIFFPQQPGGPVVNLTAISHDM
jgi:hypothetical protein